MTRMEQNVLFTIVFLCYTLIGYGMHRWGLRWLYHKWVVLDDNVFLDAMLWPLFSVQAVCRRVRNV